MIIQSDNHPYVVTLDVDLSEYPSVVLAIYKPNGTLLKKWDNEEMAFATAGSDYTISCPLTQEETAAFPVGNVNVELTALNASNLNEFWAEAEDKVVHRNYTEVMSE